MSIRFYDDAITNKILSWVSESKIQVLKPQETARLFQILADENNDEPIKLPLVAISREPNITIDVTTKRSLTFNGVKINELTGETVPDTLKVMHLDAIPITINYQLDIYTRRYEESTEYVRNFIFNLVNYPKMIVNIPYNNADIQHVCYIRLQSTVTDNSDIPQKLFADQFTRWTLDLRIDDAFLFSIPIDEAAKIDDIKLGINAPAADPSLKLVITDEDMVDQREEIIEV